MLLTIGGLTWKSLSKRLNREIMENPTTGQPKRLLDQVKDVMRVRHYALRTEQAYSDWIRRYVKFHGMKSRADLAGGTAKIEAFLTHLAVAGQVAPSTQNQACRMVEG